MAAPYIRCSACFGRITRTDDGGDEHAIEMHRLSGTCRAATPPQERTPPQKRRQDDFFDFPLGDS